MKLLIFNKYAINIFMKQGSSEEGKLATYQLSRHQTYISWANYTCHRKYQKKAKGILEAPSVGFGDSYTNAISA